MKKTYKTKFITGLKAFGTLMIVLAHLHYQFSSLPDLSHKIITFAGYFVITFFCISAFTLALSVDKAKSFNIFRYMRRRWIRLAPAYYVMIVIGILAQVAIHHWSFVPGTVRDIFLHLTFLNLNLIYEPSQSSILGFEWMIPILFWFYLLIPLLLYVVRKRFTLFCMIFTAAVYLHFHLNALVTYKGAMGGFWSMQVWIIMYVYTILIYALHKDRSAGFFHNSSAKWTLLHAISLTIPFIVLFTNLQTSSERLYSIFLILLTCYLLWGKPYVLRCIAERSGLLKSIVDNLDIVVLLIIIIKYMLNLYFIKNPHIIVLLWFANILLIGMEKPFVIRMLFENSVMQFIGTISYGIYLDHNLAITTIGYIIPPQFVAARVVSIVGLSIGCAYLLYLYIEQPLQTILIRRFGS